MDNNNIKKLVLTPDKYEVLDSMEKKVLNQRLSAGPKKTKIVIEDHDTEDILGVYENKIVISGSIFNATNAFGIDSPVLVPNYNDDMGLQNTLDYNKISPKNNPIVCLFCVDDSGCGTDPTDVYVPNFTDRISPSSMMPFRYVDATDDLNDDLRKIYFGRKIEDNNKISYYFKTFDTTPELILQYTDGTQINDQIYNIDTDQSAECYVETRLRITALDFRDYFEQVLGWDKARISSISLCYAWYDDTIDQYQWFQNIVAYTKLNFSWESMVSLSKSVDIIYEIFY